MRLLKKQTCRWLDSCMDCCRHPSTYERMRQLGVFAEFKCRCRKGCGYEKYDGSHPMWDCAAASMPPSIPPETNS